LDQSVLFLEFEYIFAIAVVLVILLMLGRDLPSKQGSEGMIRVV
jgi:hypothetical protein